MFKFPSGAYIGKLSKTDYPQGLCTDSAGDVYVVDNITKRIGEYRHGALKPLRFLAYPGGYSDNYPTGCATDPTTGDLAVMHGEDLARTRDSSSYSDVWIYRHAKGKPSGYSIATFDYLDYLCYDDDGNLFVDGETRYLNFGLSELAKGKTTFVALTLDKKTIKKVAWPGAMQWNDGLLAVGDPAYPNNYIFRLSISGTTASFAGRTKLLSSYGLQEFAIQGDVVVATQDGAAAIWNYPAGRKPVTVLNQVYAGYGAVVSLGSR